jgi:glycosyltransferase involved in cell wall biosynthesis
LANNGPRLAPGAARIQAPALPEGFTLLQVTPRLEAGGVEQVTLDLAAAVARAGAGSLVASQGGRLEAELAASGARLARMPVHSKNPFTMAANAARLAAVIRREKVSLIHVRSRAPAFSALSAARATGVPLIATYHGIYGAGSAVKRWYNAIMTRGDLVIANSAYTRAHVVFEHSLSLDQVAVVPEGIDVERFDPKAVSAARIAAVRAAWGLAETDRRQVILLAGRLTRLKGQRLLVEAVGRYAGRDDLVVILAGGGGRDDYRAEVEAAAAVAGLSSQVRLVGPVDDMPAAYAAADLVVAPSTQPESFGRTVVEAGAMRRPVIASAHGGPAETIVHRKTGWLAPPGDVDAWCAAIDIALSQGADERAAMGRAARARVKRLYSLAAMCEATFAVYRRVLEARA